uniref:Uncharacterized protein n=1 Tax=Oryzias latipes TaxID=8090 RepID=A0A3P9IED9_ORYLA
MLSLSLHVGGLTLLSSAAPAVDMSGHDLVCFDKTFEAAEALLHMESPGGLHNERSTVRFGPAAEDVMMETVVEVSTEVGAIEEESFPIPPDCEPAAKKKRGGGRKPKMHQPASNGSYDLGIKKRPREGKGLLLQFIIIMGCMLLKRSFDGGRYRKRRSCGSCHYPLWCCQAVAGSHVFHPRVCSWS